MYSRRGQAGVKPDFGSVSDAIGRNYGLSPSGKCVVTWKTGPFKSEGNPSPSQEDVSKFWQAIFPWMHTLPST